MESAQRKIDVFISFATVDKEVASGIYNTLKDAGVNCWVSFENLIPGQNYTSEIAKVIKECRVVILVFSKAASESEWVQVEANMAFSDRKVIMPYKIDNTNIVECEKFRPLLQLAHWTDSSSNWKSKLPDLAIAVRKTLALPPIKIARTEATSSGARSKPQVSEQSQKSGSMMPIIATVLVVAAVAIGAFLFLSKPAEDTVPNPIETKPVTTVVAKPDPVPEPKVETPAPTMAAKKKEEAVAKQESQTMAAKSKNSGATAGESAAVKSLYNKGMKAYNSGDYAAAIKYFEQAGNGGSLGACEMLDTIYSNGVGNYAPNKLRAEEWRNKANKLR